MNMSFIIKYKNFISQKDFYNKIKNKNNLYLKNNLCWLVNIFIILKCLRIKISEANIIKKAIKLNAYNNIHWWKYDWLIKLFRLFFKFKKNICIKKVDFRFFHKIRLNILLNKYHKYIFIASIRLKENHLIIINKFTTTSIYYSSVWTKDTKAVFNKKMSLNNFYKIYNNRWLLIYNKNKHHEKNIYR